jgi:hypothetical protein
MCGLKAIKDSSNSSNNNIEQFNIGEFLNYFKLYSKIFILKKLIFFSFFILFLASCKRIKAIVQMISALLHVASAFTIL